MPACRSRWDGSWSRPQSLALLGARLCLANVFFSSGLTKAARLVIDAGLVQDIYNVPVLPPVLAPYMGTAGELVLPVLLVLG